MEYEYASPEFVLEGTEELIHQRMLDTLPGDIDKTEGGFAWDATRPAAIELAQAYNALDMAVQLIFPMYANSGWLDLHGLTRGIYRKAAVAATGEVEVNGVAGRGVPKGFRFATPSSDGEPNVIFESVEDVRIGEDGRVTVPIRCVEPGSAGNVPANSITLMGVPAIGIGGISNPKETSGGADEEDDDGLRDRIVLRDISIEESYCGSTADYKRWAMSVPGVGGAVVIPTFNGPGTVKIVIVDEEGKPANDEIIDAVRNYILSPNDPDARLAPVDAAGGLVIAAPDVKQINISVAIKLEDKGTLEAVETEFKRALVAYFTEAAEEGVVRINEIGAMLIGFAEVADYKDLLLNEVAGNVVLQSDEYPVCGSIAVVSYT